MLHCGKLAQAHQCSAPSGAAHSWASQAVARKKKTPLAKQGKKLAGRLTISRSARLPQAFSKGHRS